MATPGTRATGCTIVVSVFDGARRRYTGPEQPLVRILDVHGRSVFEKFIEGAGISVNGLPFFNNFADAYSVVVSASGHRDAGFFPVKVSPQVPQRVNLMLVKKDGGPNFSGALWEKLTATRPRLSKLLAAGAADDNAARERYMDVIENHPATAACLLNIATAMEQINLPTGTPLDYLQRLVWERLQQDRLFAWTDPELVEQVQAAAEQGEFVPVPAALHPGATSSYKQLQFGEANVQFTFHEKTTETIGGLKCILVEPDIDYFKDLAAHALLEVAVNTLGSVTDPQQVYVLRWIAGQRAGVPEFDPLYTLA